MTIQFRNSKLRYRHAARKRREGIFAVFAIFLIAALAVVSGFCINLAYMELARAEQRLAADAAVKAASITLSVRQDTNEARAEAIRIAGLHNVAGEPVVLDGSQITFGVSQKQLDGSMNFTPGAQSGMMNAVAVTTDLGNPGAKILVFPSLMDPVYFSFEQTSIAARVDMDVCLVIDRSGSMAWDLTNVPFQYPGDLFGESTIQNYFKLPHATLSRWAAVSDAIADFADVLEDNPFETRVALVSYASNFIFGAYESTVSSLDQPLTSDKAAMVSVMNDIAEKPLIGNTNIAAGLRDGIAALTDPTKTRVTAAKTIILLTDGVMTQGDDPVALAAYARENNIRVHTIAFSQQADTTLMQNVATAGGGSFYYSPDAATLRAVFKRLAETLPSMLTE